MIGVGLVDRFTTITVMRRIVGASVPLDVSEQITTTPLDPFTLLIDHLLDGDFRLSAGHRFFPVK